MSDEQDMFRMGGLFPYLKKTWAMMLIGTLALTGFPLTSGYFSKDAIIEARSGAVHLLLFLAADVPDVPWQAAGVARDHGTGA